MPTVEKTHEQIRAELIALGESETLQDILERMDQPATAPTVQEPDA